MTQQMVVSIKLFYVVSQVLFFAVCNLCESPSAVSRFCAANGYSTGEGPVEFSGDTSVSV